MIQPWNGIWPTIDPTAWVHPSAVVIGDVTLGPRVSVWPCCVLRGDQGAVRVGADTNLQDGTIAHATGGVSVVTVGARCVVGHRVLLHGCEVADGCLVGMGSILLDNCVIETEAIVGAGALVPTRARIPTRTLALGSPARVARPLQQKDLDAIAHGVETYLRLMEEHHRAAP
jgi:carbonic anhydrase/acetyltransferase-like protein (isoleucine patch superfamily)